MTYKTEFPDYTDMPIIPSEWKDVSWHNNTCPSFSYKNLEIFVDYKEASQREFPEVPRFTVLTVDEQLGLADKALVTTDDWEHVLLAVEANT